MRAPGEHRGGAGEAVRCDVAIVGAGAAGLWIACRLSRAGFACAVLEANALGAGQTICSQGIIHGGVKYALTGAAGDASRAIAAMPERWRACLAGEAPAGAAGARDPDLRAVRTLAERQHLWTTRGLVSRLGGVAASKAIRTGVTRVREAERPEAFRAAPQDIDLYEVEEPVLDPASLLGALRDEAARAGAAIVPVDGGSLRVRTNGAGARIVWRAGGAEERAIDSAWVVLSAGAGNEALLAQQDGAPGSPGAPGAPGSPEQRPGVPDSPQAQRRPLHMVMARGAPGDFGASGALPAIYGHCVSLSTLPRATITSQVDRRGRTVWHIGGGIAESGVVRPREGQIAFARREIGECTPWVDLSRVEWAAYRVDRAEGLPPGAKPGARPDEPVIRRIGARVLAAWPTKLAFAPLLAERVEEAIGAAPRGGAPDWSAFRETPPTPIAPLPWEDEGIAWT